MVFIRRAFSVAIAFYIDGLEVGCIYGRNKLLEVLRLEFKNQFFFLSFNLLLKDV